jgi:hypothetical protein
MLANALALCANGPTKLRCGVGSQDVETHGSWQL